MSTSTKGIVLAGGERHSLSISDDIGIQQAASTHLRQADDLLSAGYADAWQVFEYILIIKYFPTGYSHH
jgi:hypothetical protein